MPAHRFRKVILFLPPYSGKILGPPLGLLSLAGSLRAARYQPCIIDGAINRDYRRIVSDEIADSVCFGISLLTGPMIRDAIEIASMVRRLRPELPIVFGGWHPRLPSQQTWQEPYSDIVVRHQREKTLIAVS